MCDQGYLRNVVECVRLWIPLGQLEVYSEISLFLGRFCTFFYAAQTMINGRRPYFGGRDSMAPHNSNFTYSFTYTVYKAIALLGSEAKPSSDRKEGNENRPFMT